MEGGRHLRKVNHSPSLYCIFQDEANHSVEVLMSHHDYKEQNTFLVRPSSVLGGSGKAERLLSSETLLKTWLVMPKSRLSMARK